MFSKSVPKRVGNVEKVKIGKDPFVKHAIILYKDVSSDCPQDYIHSTVKRPVRNIIKLFDIE